MARVQVGDTVRVHCVGMLEDGTLTEDTRNEGPILFTVGQHTVIPGLELAVIGMEPGTAKTVCIPCDQAFGVRQDELAVEIDATGLDLSEVLHVLGCSASACPADGQWRPLLVLLLRHGMIQAVQLDANHPLAGENLIVEIEVLEIIRHPRGAARGKTEQRSLSARQGLKTSRRPSLMWSRRRASPESPGGSGTIA